MTKFSKFKDPLAIRFFTEREAWSLFRTAAFAEAFGWTLLISGILIVRYATPGNRDAVLIAGQLHGTIFLAYLAVVFVACGSLGWSKKLTLLAGLASVPPYGTLVFELLVAHHRRRKNMASYRQIVVRAVIMSGKKMLAYQPKENVFWCLPGGSVIENENTNQALIRTVTLQLGIEPVIGRLLYVYEYTHRGRARQEFFFKVENSAVYKSIDLARAIKDSVEIDELAFIEPAKTVDLLPSFLRTESADTKATVFFKGV
jgi:integral membrane protein